jgi:hypothetical protein
MDPNWVALRSVELNRCFTNNSNETYAYSYLPEIMRIGQLIRMANMLRMRGYIPYENAKALGNLLGLQPATIRENLETLEQIQWIVIHKKSGQLDTIEEHIPLTSQMLEQVGKIELSPEKDVPNIEGLSDVEYGTIQSLNLCAKTPCSIEALSSEVKLDGKKFDTLIRLGKAGRYLDIQDVSDGRVVFSPLYYFNKYEAIQKKLQRQTIASLEPLQNIMRECAHYVGKPLQSLGQREQQLALSGINTGWLIPVQVSSPFNVLPDVTFLYPPMLEFQDSMPIGDIFEKAKVLISSMRLGENYAPTSRIKNPLNILQTLERDGKLGRPHKDALEQYKIPASKGLFTFKWEDGVSFYGNIYSGWMPYLTKSEENLQVIRTAISMMSNSSDVAATTLKSDIESADIVLRDKAPIYESLEYRSSPIFSGIKKDPELEKRGIELALALQGGSYK